MNKPLPRSARGGVIIVLVAALLAGCRQEDIDETYAKRRGEPGRESVNGTAVLAALFEEAGHRVASWRRLSPKLEQFSVVVWAPDSFQSPGDEQRDRFEEWLAGASGRTLIYIGRDYDAGEAYWRKILPRAPASQVMEVMRRLATAQAKWDAQRSSIPEDAACDWYKLVPGDSQLVRKPLQGAWSGGIQASRAEIEIGSRFDRPTDAQIKQWRERRYDAGTPVFETLLSSGNAALATRITLPEWNGSQILLIPNGSFLLNLPLVNHEHRKLAGRLIAACGPASKVMFLESGSEQPPVLSTDPDMQAPTGFEVFTVWPIGAIAVHLVLLGITACFVLFPVFGRPKQPEEDVLSDFGKHVEALGELLQATGDQEYATARVREYHAHVHRDATAGKRREGERLSTRKP